MKKIFRAYIVETGGLYLSSMIAAGIVFDDGVRSILIAGGALMVATFVIRPIINLLLLPINMITFGFFRWISHAITLYLVDLVLDDFSIVEFAFAGLDSVYLTLPPITVGSGVLAYIMFSFLLSFLTGVVYWISDH